MKTDRQVEQGIVRSASAKVMGLEIDVLEEETLLSKVKDFLSNDYLNIIHFVSVGILEECASHPELKKSLQEADLLLPGERAVLSLHHVDVLEAGGMVVSYQSMEIILHGIRKNHFSIYIIARNEKELEVYKQIFNHMKLVGNFVGSHCMDQDSTTEILINDINIHTPDILIFSMDSPEQEEWLEENKQKLNSKLCIVLGDISKIIVRQNKEVPGIIRKLGVAKVYYLWKRNINWLNTRKIRIFRKKMVNYNNKREESE